MSIKSNARELRSFDAEETTQELLVSTREESRRHSGKKVVLRAFPPSSYDLSIVVPTRNERDNVRPLLEAIHTALHGLCIEVIFVDDSDDDTPAIIQDRAKAMHSSQFLIRVAHRPGGNARAGGLSSAVVQGLQMAQAVYVAVIDADLQHPPEQLHLFYNQAISQQVDLVLASRYIKGGSYQGLDGVGRRLVSIGMKWTAKLLFPEQLLHISDPLGGFFLVRRSLLTDVPLRPIGYKILLEILIRAPWKHVLEVPYHFQVRTHGQSKANTQQGILALRHMVRLLLEVPTAGRILKISLLVLLNLLITLIVFTVNRTFPQIGSNLNTVVFGLMALLDFAIFNRFIFPSPVETRHDVSSAPILVALEDTDTVRLPAMKRNIRVWDNLKVYALEDIQTAKLPSTQRNTKTNLSAIELNATETGKFPILPTTPPAIPAVAVKRPISRFRTIRSEKILSIVMVITVFLTTVLISRSLPGATLTFAALFIGAAVILTKKVNRHDATTMLLVIAVGVATIDYLSWRFEVTNWQGWWFSVPLLFAETLGGLHVLGFQFTIWPWSPPKVAWSTDPTQLPIFIFIPTVNEGVTILRPTLEGAIAARDSYLTQYPHAQVTIVVCNDGYAAKVENWEEIDVLAQEMGVCCVTRRKGGGAKAANIENARQVLRATGDALLVIFDADQVAKPDFLLKTIPPFRDVKMGWVQTGQYYANLANPVSRWADDQQSMFYNLLCPGKAALNAAFICGTNVVIRASALDQIGGLPQDSVTEDFAASIHLHSSWRSVYLTDVLATGLGPLDMPSYLKQQSRWAIGTLGVLRTHWRDIFLPRKNGLKIEQRIQYFLACTHYLCGLRDLIYVISPMLFIFTGVPAVLNATLGEYLWHFVPYSLLSVIILWYTSRGLTGLKGIIIGFGSFPVLIGSLLSVILHRKIGFSVTSKQRNGKRSLRYLWIYVFFFVLCIASLLWLTQSKGQQQSSLFISVLWIIYSMVMLGGFFWLIIQDIRFQRSAQQSPFWDEATAKQSYPSKLLTRKQGLNPVWNIGLGMLIAAPILASSVLNSLPLFASNSPNPFLISQEKIATPYFGVSLPVQLLYNQPPLLERELGTQFAIIGRTQDIVHDHFDTAWADQLAAEDARPWITLQFGEFGANQKPPLDADLPAIINGLHDQEIRRWAEDIRNYDKPVYLTILLHADKNWSLSSGVANGGIPEDVSQAWMHVRSIFSAVGAKNVAWVWAPADPIHDQQFAPPASAIDAVLQSFIDYPGTTWGNPATVLHELVKRYPTKPIIVEASVDGPASQKAAWLSRLGQAVDSIPQVYALLYHEGGPGLNPGNAQFKNWSLASDPVSLSVMRHIVVELHTQATVRTY